MSASKTVVWVCSQCSGQTDARFFFFFFFFFESPRPAVFLCLSWVGCWGVLCGGQRGDMDRWWPVRSPDVVSRIFAKMGEWGRIAEGSVPWPAPAARKFPDGLPPERSQVGERGSWGAKAGAAEWIRQSPGGGLKITVKSCADRTGFTRGPVAADYPPPLVGLLRRHKLKIPNVSRWTGR